MTDTITRQEGETPQDFAARLRAHAKSLNPGRVRFKHLGVRVTEEESAEIAEAAETLGLSVSDLLRRAGMHAIENRRLRGEG